MMFSQMAFKTLEYGQDESRDYKAQWQAVLYESKLGRVKDKAPAYTPSIGFPKLHRSAMAHAAASMILPPQTEP